MVEISKGMDKQNSNKSQQFVYISLIIAPIVYILILVILQIQVLNEIKIPTNIFSDNFLNLILFLFVLLSIVDIIVTYKILIPFSCKIENYEYRFNWNVIILACGGTAIGIYGLIIGILWWSNYNFIPFYLVLPFMGIGIIHGYYLYSRFILKENM